MRVVVCVPFLMAFIFVVFATLCHKRNRARIIDRENNFNPEDGWVETRAPKGKLRIIREDMEDGQLSIVAQVDANSVDVAKEVLNCFQSKMEHHLFQPIYTMWDDQGNEIQ